MTNNDRIVLLMIHVGHPLPDDAKWVSNSINNLHDGGYIEFNAPVWMTTGKGSHYIGVLAEVPTPRQIWTCERT